MLLLNLEKKKKTTSLKIVQSKALIKVAIASVSNFNKVFLGWEPVEGVRTVAAQGVKFNCS